MREMCLSRRRGLSGVFTLPTACAASTSSGQAVGCILAPLRGLNSLLKKGSGNFSAASAAEAGLILGHLRRGLKPRPFKTKLKAEFFSKL